MTAILADRSGSEDCTPEALGHNLKTTDLPPGDRIVKRIAEKTGSDFDHGDPANYFLRHRDVILPRLSAPTLDQFEQLLGRINRTLPPET